MLPKGQRPVIGRLSELLVSRSRCRPAFLDSGSSSPTSHFDFNLILSPSPRNNFTNGGGVGLAIVAALDDSSAISGGEILVKHAVCSPRSNSGRPIPVPGSLGSSFSPDEEDFTHVTTRRPHETSTRVYYDGVERGPRCLIGRTDGAGGSSRKSPPRPADRVTPARPTSDLLHSCYLCEKNLDGNDIFMYREKAFCSTECRSKQMRRDEMKDRCGSEASRSAEVSNSSYNRGEIFSTGILAI